MLCVNRKKDLKIDNKWYTHIDYDKFFELLESGKQFSYKDYMAETPSWAVIGADERGFNPNETSLLNNEIGIIDNKRILYFKLRLIKQNKK